MPALFLSRRAFLLAGGAAMVLPLVRRDDVNAQAALDVTFLFVADIHACRMESGLSPNCEQEGKTDANLLKNIAALNGITRHAWPAEIGGKPTGLRSAGQPIATPLGLITGGDATDDGGGQTTLPSEGTQLLQFSHRYQQGAGTDRVNFPVYVGLGNHDLDQDGPRDHLDWYRRELRDYVELNHRPSVIFKPPVPVVDYDLQSDCYSWEWGGLHLVQLHRYGGDTRKDAVSSLPWLKRNLATYAADGRPVVLFQHYGWDIFSIERWDPAATTFDDHGVGEPHWWSEADRRALLDVLPGYNVIGLFHGHQHDTPMIYSAEGLDLFKPKAAFMGGFAVARVTTDRFEVALAEGDGESLKFTHAFSKAINSIR